MGPMTTFGDGRSVKITQTSAKDVRLELDGVDVARTLCGLDLSMRPGDLPELTLYAQGKVADEPIFEGLARVSVADQASADPGPAAAVFLRAIDPGELEKAALARPDLGTGEHSLTAAMLAQLVDWAEGRS